jgi:sialic acid synthase SpsE
MKQEISFGGRMVGEGHPVYVIAEIGSNHGSDKAVVRELIDIAAEAGFDAVKFQTYEPLEVFSGKITTTELGTDVMYGPALWWEVARDRILMPREWFAEMFGYAKEKSLQVFSTVHSGRDAEFLMQFDPPVFKVASIDVTYLDFLADLASFKKPIILSTGMHYLGEVEAAVETILKNGNDELAILHCVSNYPPRPSDVNLHNITMFRHAFELPVGFSDHHPENFMDVAAVALGACIIEKHVTLDRSMLGPDHPFALDPHWMHDLVRSVRDTEAAMGSYKRVLSESELKSRVVTRRSFVAREDIKSGEVLTADKIKLTRPGTGIHPKYKEQVLGRKARVDIEEEVVITWDMLD